MTSQHAEQSTFFELCHKLNCVPAIFIYLSANPNVTAFRNRAFKKIMKKIKNKKIMLSGALLVAQVLKNLPVMQETQVQPLD